MINETLLRLVPPILRARDFRLYDQKGRRLLDLWQNGGAAILGHTPAGQLRSLKNTAERGLFAPLPHPQEKRFHKALAVLLPGMSFLLYRSDTALLHTLNTGGFPIPVLPGKLPAENAAFPDPALSAALPPPPTPILWRPFLDSVLPPDRPLIPVLPLPWPDTLRVLALPAALLQAPPEAVATLPASGLISPVTLSAATRSVYDLIAATPARGRVSYPRIREALVKGAEKNGWQGRGIYLYYGESLDDEAYAELFRCFLDQGFLLPPTQDQPLILPGVLSAGEEAKLAGLLEKKL